MEEQIKLAIEEYQCWGCMKGNDISCFKANENGGAGCGKHFAGTIIGSIGSIFLGMPKGFNRLGPDSKMKPYIFNAFSDCEWYNGKFNIPVWKYLNEEGHTLVRGISPRRNEGFIHIFLEDCRDRINCLEITQDDVDFMD